MKREEIRRLKREKGDTHGAYIAYIHPGEVDGVFCDSLAHTLLKDAQSKGRFTKWGGVIGMETSPRIAAARNDQVREFFRQRERSAIPAEWLIFIDSDMQWTPEDMDKLFEILEADDEDVRIVGGLCFAGGRSSAAYPTLYVLVDKEEMVLDKVVDYPKNKLITVSATGCAFLAIHHTVLETMFEQYKEVNGQVNMMPWFRDGTQNGREYGEDIWFCLAANGAGFKTYVHTGIKIGHRKSFILDEEYYDAKRSD